MGKNVQETVSDELRGESVGQLTPEAQGLWDKYNSIFGTIQNAPDRTVRLRSGATTQIPDPGMLLKQRALQKVLMGMTGTGLGQRAKPQPGMLAQMAPFVTALGSDPKFQKWLASVFGGNGTTAPIDTTGMASGGLGGDDWGDYADWGSDMAQDIDWDAIGEAGYW